VFFNITDPAVDKVEGVFFIKCEKNGRVLNSGFQDAGFEV
jgi:hypothetical protein